MKNRILSLMLALGVFVFAACEEEVTPPAVDTTAFQIKITNEIDLLAAHVFNTPSNASEPGPIPVSGVYYETQFKAYPGSRLNFISMLANSNDWFFAAGANGIALFDASGAPVTGDITANVRLYDAGTEEEDPATIATVPDGGTTGSPDDDNTVRSQESDVSSYLRADLSYENGYFNLRLTRTDEGVLTPGLILIHAQENYPLFTIGEPDRGQGLKEIAEAGMPNVLYNYLTETAADGSPLRLSSSHSPFSPGVVYAFKADEQDPLFTQGEAAKAGSGLEELSEDGNNEVIYNYLSGLGLPVAKPEEAGGIGPGGSFTFNLEVPDGYKLGFATMFVQSNDWFVSFNNDGVALFDASGNPKSGIDYSVQSYLFDSGTEIDEAIGFGDGQPMRQSGPNVGAVDPNTTIRRVSELEDGQFGKGRIASAPGVVYIDDERGGYNMISIEIIPR